MDVERFLTLVSFDSNKKLEELGIEVGMKSDKVISTPLTKLISLQP
jgi:hypothetical protein